MKVRRPARHFDYRHALNHIRVLSEVIGPRQEGTRREKRAAAYLRGRLEAYGFAARSETVPIPGGGVSQNVIATEDGRGAGDGVGAASDAGVIIIGAHYDSARTSPGANDNAAGAAVVVELARVMRDSGCAPTLRFVLFGAEEELEDDPDERNLFGSLAYVKSLSRDDRADIAGAICLDMVARGPDFYARSATTRSRPLSSALITFAKARRVGLEFYRAPPSGGWSDYEAFELAGVPAVWLEREDDPYYHSAADTFRRIQPAHVRTAGTLLEGFLRSLTADELARLRRSNKYAN